jgi:universal stress protein A
VGIEFQKILVPVDFSDACWPALTWADQLARLNGVDGVNGAQLDLLHVWETPALASPLEDEIAEQAAAALEQLVTEAKARGIKVDSARAVSGSPRETIIEEAARGHYDLIVIGRHGRSRLARVLLGSVAERVVRLAGCPVLVAQPHTDVDP